MLAPGTRMAVGRWWRAFPRRIKACGGYKGQVEEERKRWMEREQLGEVG